MALQTLALVAVLAGCTKTGTPDRDAGIPDASMAMTCPPASESGFQPKAWVPPAAARSDCSSDDLDAYWSACLAPSSILIQCQQFIANHSACAACLSPDGSSVAGPLRVQPGSLTPNVSGCIALVLDDPSAGGCGARDQIVRDCASYVCVCGDGGTSCPTQAREGACKTQQMALCAELGMASPCALDEGFEPDFKRIAATFCSNGRAGAD